MIKRYDHEGWDKPQLLRIILNRRQEQDKCTLKFANDMYRLGEKADLKEDFIIQTIISNLRNENQLHYELHIQNEFTLKKLFDLINKIEKKTDHIKKAERFAKMKKSQTPELKALFKVFPKNYNIKDTLKQNTIFLNEILKSLESLENKINFTSNKENTDMFDIVKFLIKLNGKDVIATIDTGAKVTVISEDLANELDIPIRIKNKKKIAMADNSCTISDGTISNLPIYVKCKIYCCEAIVLKNAAQELLIGTF
ncbi:hypothetical protein COBT_002572 [Conglomerata obtusa]